MPKLLRARPAKDADEEAKVRHLGQSRLAPTALSQRAWMIVRSWDGLRTRVIAEELRCHPQTVREHVARFNGEGMAGFLDRPGSGRRPRLTEAERSTIISLVNSPPPGALLRVGEGLAQVEAKGKGAEGKGQARWSLDGLAETAQARGVKVARSQIRRIFLKEGVRWRDVHSWAESGDPEFAPKESGPSRSTPSPR